MALVEQKWCNQMKNYSRDLDDFDFEGSRCWMVIVNEGSRSAFPIKPDFPELDAALYFVKEKMTKAMLKKTEMRPKSIKLSDKEIKAWNAYKKIMGKDLPTYFEYASLDEIAKAGCEVIRKQAVKMKKQLLDTQRSRNDDNTIMDLELN